jgi:hypothetical protein
VRKRLGELYTNLLPRPDAHDGFPLVDGDADPARAMGRLEVGCRVWAGGGRFDGREEEGGGEVVEGRRAGGGWRRRGGGEDDFGEGCHAGQGEEEYPELSEAGEKVRVAVEIPLRLRALVSAAFRRPSVAPSRTPPCVISRRPSPVGIDTQISRS